MYLVFFSFERTLCTVEVYEQTYDDSGLLEKSFDMVYHYLNDVQFQSFSSEYLDTNGVHCFVLRLNRNGFPPSFLHGDRKQSHWFTDSNPPPFYGGNGEDYLPVTYT